MFSAGTAGAQCSPDCAGDLNGDRQVTVDELVSAVNAALSGCGSGSGCVDCLISSDSAYDRYARDDAKALSEAAQRGVTLFFSDPSTDPGLYNITRAAAEGWFTVGLDSGGRNCRCFPKQRVDTPPTRTVRLVAQGFPRPP